jgi:predicted TIM-barrel fold metal-dependent hydrolase
MERRARREFLKQVVATGVTAAAVSPLGSATAQAKSPVIDCHLHCFSGVGDDRFPYHENAPYRPEKAATPQHLLACMDGGGVDYAVVVHPEPYQDDHRYLAYCLDVGAGRLKATCLYFAEKPGSIEELKAFVKRYPDGVVALRIHAWLEDRLPPFDRPELIRALWKAGDDLGLAVQLHFVPKYAARFEPFIKEFPDTTVIVDHFGRVPQGTPEENEVIYRWSRFQNVVIKMANLPPEDEAIAPVIKRFSRGFGAERMIYGGGFGPDATPELYRAFRGRVESLLGDYSEADRALVLGGTAARIFGIDEAG